MCLREMFSGYFVYCKTQKNSIVPMAKGNITTM